MRAVSAPVEGTVLSVGAAAASAALASGDLAHASAGTVAVAAARSAREALARTPEQLPVLARAGVVDAGGRGLVVLLDALAEVLTGEPLPAEPPMPSRAALFRSLTVAREAGSDEFGYEVQFLLDAPEPAIEPLKARLADLGDSLVIVGAAPTWHVHVHVNDVGAAIEAGVDAGRPSRITVTRFADQIVAASTAAEPVRPQFGPDTEALALPEPAVGAKAEGNVLAGETGPGARSPARAGRAVVVVCSGDSLAALFAGEGATVVSGTPSTAEILAAIESTGAARVVLLPNDRDVAAVAGIAAAEARAQGIRAGVVPTRSPVQGAGRARRSGPGAALRRRRDRDGRGGRGVPLRRGDDRGPGGADRGRPLPPGRRARPHRGGGQPDRPRSAAHQQAAARPDARRRRRAGHAGGRRRRAGRFR